MAPAICAAVRVTRLVPGLFECGLLLWCWRTGSSSTLTVTGIVGESSLLPCLDTNLRIQANEEIRVYWQVANQCIYAFYSGQEHVNQNYSNRAKLLTTEFKHGNFSLLLTDLQLNDDAKYICVIQLRRSSSGYSVVLQVTVILQVAAHYAEPTLTAEQGEGELMTLTCSSVGGYPEPTVYWTSGLLSLENSTAVDYMNCSAERLCNVTSVLWAHTKLTSITCKIYNGQLKENKTATFNANFSREYNKEMIDPVHETHHRWIVPTVIIVILLFLLLLYVLHQHFRRRALSGDCSAQPGLTPYEDQSITGLMSARDGQKHKWLQRPDKGQAYFARPDDHVPTADLDPPAVGELCRSFHHSWDAEDLCAFWRHSHAGVPDRGGI